MTPVRSGIVFSLIIVLFIGVSFFVSILARRGDSFQMSLFQDIMMSEGIVLIPGLIVATVCGSEAGEIFRFRKIRVSTVFLIILFMICMEPLIAVVNAVSLLFSDNQALEITKQYINKDSSFLYVAMIVALIGPVAEELAFRGVIYAGLRKSGRLLSAIVLQAFLFGLMHLNFNQMSYAFVLGIAFGILNEVTNSLWPGIIGHIMVNFGGVVSSFAIMKYMPEALDMDYSRQEILYTIMIYGMLAIVFASLAGLLLLKIAKNEPGGRFRLHRIFVRRDLKIITGDGREVAVKKPPVWSIPVVFGIVIALVEMIVSMVLKTMH